MYDEATAIHYRRAQAVIAPAACFALAAGSAVVAAVALGSAVVAAGLGVIALGCVAAVAHAVRQVRSGRPALARNGALLVGADLFDETHRAAEYRYEIRGIQGGWDVFLYLGDRRAASFSARNVRLPRSGGNGQAAVEQALGDLGIAAR